MSSIGVVETHGRDETEALLDGLEIIPRRRVDYKGRVLDEMDLDAILKRRPKLVLVDELAHTNAPGSRHPKRYLDVEELLEAGIDVYTTLNIQHLESLNDVVAKITRIRVRETVPDSILDRADDVEVVDLTPEDLIQRLKEGKVYVPQQAERAVRALLHARQSHGAARTGACAARRSASTSRWSTICARTRSPVLGRRASACWCVSMRNHPAPRSSAMHGASPTGCGRPGRRLHVETSRTLAPARIAARPHRGGLRLAERLGGEAVTMPGQDVAIGIVDYAQANNFTHIVIAKSRRSRWSELLRSSITHQLIRRAGDISVHVIAEPREPPGQEGTIRALRSIAIHST